MCIFAPYSVKFGKKIKQNIYNLKLTQKCKTKDL